MSGRNGEGGVQVSAVTNLGQGQEVGELARCGCVGREPGGMVILRVT